MTCIVDFAARATLDAAIEHVKAIAPLLVGRAIAFTDVPCEQAADDQNGAGATRARAFRDGEVVLHASCVNDSGNPRDGYGYILKITLASTDETGAEKPLCWLNGGGWDPIFEHLRMELVSPMPEVFDAVRALVASRLPEDVRDETDEFDTLAVTIDDYARRGHDAAIAQRLATWRVPERPRGGSAWLIDALVEHKARTVGLDDRDRAAWLRAAPSSAAAWRAATELETGPYDTDDARLFAALLDPFRPSVVAKLRTHRPAEANCLATGLLALWRDAHFRVLYAEDTAALADPLFESLILPSENLTRFLWTPASTPAAASSQLYALSPCVELTGALGFSSSPVGERGAATRIGPAPLAEPGVFWAPGLPIGVGWSGRASLLEPPPSGSPSAAKSVRALGTLILNCENRISGFGHAWLGGAERLRVRWRWSISSSLMPRGATVAVDWREPRFAEALEYSPIDFEVLSDGPMTTARRELEARLSSSPAGWTAVQMDDPT